MSDCACGVDEQRLAAQQQLLVSLEITARCNNQCPGCGNVFAAHRTPLGLSGAEWIDLVERGADHIGYVQITGGEPTLHPDFERILQHVDRLGVPITLFTNGRWHDPAGLVAFLSVRENLNGLLISLHGADATAHEAFAGVAGAFDETLANIELALAAGLTVTTSTVLTRQSCPQVSDVLALTERLGVQGVSFQRYIGEPLPDLSPDLDALRDAMGQVDRYARTESMTPALVEGDCACAVLSAGNRVRFGTPIPQCFLPNSSRNCMAGIRQITIDPWGRVRPCNHSTLIAGDARTESLADILQSDVMRQFRALIPAECRVCEHGADCGGGCRALMSELGLVADPLMIAAQDLDI